MKTFGLAVTLAGNGAGRVTSAPPGIDCGARCSADFPQGSNVTLTEVSGTGSKFGGWGGDCSGSNPTQQIALNSAHGCTATFLADAAHLAFPQMPGHGQPPLARLQLVTVTFAGYPFETFVQSFGDFVVGSQWLAAVTQDFGPIAATHLAKVTLPASAAGARYDSIVLNNIGAALPYPSADPTGLLYLFYQPTPCTGGGGYHSYVTYNGQPVAYAVALNCQDERSAEGVASHEIAEALTEPYLRGEFFDATSAPWVGEVGDICNWAPWWIEGGFRFCAIWSNKAALAGGSPCVPWVAGKAYYNVSPSPSAPQIVAAGASAVFTLTGWSTGAGNPWTLSVNADNYAQQDFDTAPQVSTSINSGTTAQLTLHVPAGTPSGRRATVRVHSRLTDSVDGVSGFSNDWSLQIISQ
jgi:hypothetical protein